MILDNLANAERYYGMHPGLAEAFEFLKRSRVEELEGRIEIDGERVYAMVIKAEGQGHEGALLETHKRYIDIQFCVSGTQEFGWKPEQECVTVAKAFDEAGDYGFYKETPDVWVSVKPGQFAIFFPWDGHTPKGGTGALHKILVKVAV